MAKTDLTELEEVHDGLVFANPAWLTALHGVMLGTTLVVPDDPSITFDVDTAPTIGQASSWSVMEKLVSDGYVAMIDRNPSLGSLRFRFTKSPIEVADSAKVGGTHTIIMGPDLAISAAKAAVVFEPLPGPTWIAPAVLAGVAIAGIVWIFRR